MYENVQNVISMSFTISYGYFLACIDANDMIAQYLKNPKMCYMETFLQINWYSLILLQISDPNLSSSIAELPNTIVRDHRR